MLYRVLFLLFAEARGLVPLWHPVYRERYSLEAITRVLLEGRPCKGLWRAVQAISRLAHAGCTAGELRVTAFNGRLFAPSQAAAFDSTRISDAVMSRTVIALSSTPNGRHGGRARILYRDLDVEQLGAVYERVLEYEPTTDGPAPLQRTRDIRKSSGSFYTPRAVTTYLVPPDAGATDSRPHGRRDPHAARARSCDGKWSVSRRGMPLPGIGGRRGARSRGAMAHARCHVSRSRGAPSRDRLALSFWR